MFIILTTLQSISIIIEYDHKKFRLNNNEYFSVHETQVIVLFRLWLLILLFIKQVL